MPLLLQSYYVHLTLHYLPIISLAYGRFWSAQNKKSIPLTVQIGMIAILRSITLAILLCNFLGLAVTHACCDPPPPRCPPRSSRPARPNPPSWPTPSCPAAPRLEKRRHFYTHVLAQVRITRSSYF
jgi:hypothetical protein